MPEERIVHDQITVSALSASITPAAKLLLHQAEVDNLLGLIHLYSDRPSERNPALASQLFSRSSFLVHNEVSYRLHRALALWQMDDLLTAIPVAIAARNLAIHQFPQTGGVFLGRILGRLHLCHAAERFKAVKYRQVLDAIDKASAVCPLTYDALCMRAQAYTALQMTLPAIDTLTAMIDMQPLNPDLYAKRANLLKSLNQPIPTYHDLLQVCSMQPDHPDVPTLDEYIRKSIVCFKNRASECEIQNDLKSAVNALSNVLSLDPADWLSLLKRGTLHATLGESNDAILDISRYLLDPARDISRDIQAKRELANICTIKAQKAQEEGNTHVTMQFCNKALELDPSYPEAWRLRAELYCNRRELGKAIQDMQHAYTLDKSNTMIKHRLVSFYSESGHYHLSHGEFAFASAEFTNAIEMDDTCVSAFWGRAKACMGLQNPYGARRDIQRVLQLDAKHPGARTANTELTPPPTQTRPFPVRNAMTTMLIAFVLVLPIPILAVLLYSLKRRSKAPDKSVIALLVLGDLGHSPRMQYHAISLARSFAKVYLIGYKQSRLAQEILDNPKIHLVYIPAPTRMPNARGLRASITYLVMGVWRVMSQMVHVARALTSAHVAKSGAILVQNPPAIPTLAIVPLVSYLLGAKFIIDWHNFGFTLMEMRLHKGHVLVRIARLYEMFFAGCAHGHLAVTCAMKEALVHHWKIKAPIHVYYDRPPSHFRPLSASNKADFKTHLHIPATRPLLISSTSWTEDEDFTLLLSALLRYDALPLPPVVVIVTGKGPLRSHFETQIKHHQWTRVDVRFAWLSREEYPLLVACADLGICLHTSSSGLDLPMKVVDMFGCGVPVCAVAYRCLDELVEHDVNGFVFTSSDGLFQQLMELLSDWPSNTKTLARLRMGVESTRTKIWGAETDTHQQLASFLATLT
ncbi:chitobiosyldiphosphodolichol beta-mannosyltransferase [Synchytrium endobioticum]|uniref:Chitobiosyldiphosphodolichol beta-mannosyltransferase n=1 Tax=Synchytrium endobioticum TaxID=286115 RepID=A0A507CD92_9FUNG|nr:chitobiosyldiphosphodolichol beta-mannosyltransferase [Synchytrium endobioticum]